MSDILPHPLSSLHTTPRRTTALSSLPLEIITQIALHLDAPSAVSLSRVSRIFHGPTERPIWRNIDLSVAERPLLQPIPSRDRGALDVRCRGDTSSTSEAEQDRWVLQRQKIKSIMAQGDARTWDLVETLRIAPQPRSSHLSLAFLDLVGPGLCELVIEAPLGPELDGGDLTAYHGPLSVKLLDACFFTPHLAYLRITEISSRVTQLISTLLMMASSLLSLDVEVLPLPTQTTQVDKDTLQLPPEFIHAKLQRLRIASQRGITWGQTDRYDSYTAIHEIIQYLPCIRQLSLTCESERCYPKDDEYCDVFAYLMAKDEDPPREMLRDLYWGHHPCAFGKSLDVSRSEGPRGGELFAHLQRVAFAQASWYDIFGYLPILPNMHSIYLPIATTATSLPSLPSSRLSGGASDNHPVRQMMPQFAATLRESPHLRYIRSSTGVKHDDTDFFDRLDRLALAGDNDIIGVVSSIRYGEQEVLHAELLLPFAQIEAPAAGPVFTKTTAAIHYISEDGTERAAYFEALPQPAESQYSDFEGEAVPVEVIAEIYRVEGLEWPRDSGRGVEVGEAAWEVLLDWQLLQDLQKATAWTERRQGDGVKT